MGDSIIAINNQNITELKHGDIIRVIQDAGKRLCFKIRYKRSAEGKCTR